MQRQFATQWLFIIGGLVSGVIAFSATPRIGGSPPERLATVCTLLISGGFLLTGVVWLRDSPSDRTRYVRIPGATLVLLGGGGIVVALLTLQPLQGGITQGLRAILMGIVLLAGGSVGIAGWRWIHRREMRYPLALQTTGWYSG